MTSPRQGQVDVLAGLLRRHVLAVRDVLKAAGVEVDPATAELDHEALWGILVEGAEARKRAAETEAQVDRRQQQGGEGDLDPDLLAEFPDLLPRLSKQAELQPELYPRARRAAPKDRAHALLEDYRDGLERMQVNFDKYATREHLRQWLVSSFEDAGLSVRREERSGSIFVLHRQGSAAEVKCASYVALATAKNQNKVSFMVNGIKKKSSGISWVILYPRSLRRAYLVPISEIRRRFTDKKQRLPDSASYTVHRGSPETALFENRIGQLLAAFEIGNEASHPVI